MRKYSMLVFALSLIFIAGCATGIANYTVTSRDKEMYKSSDTTPDDYKTNAYVLETRGDGEIACVNLGTTNGINKGTKITFYKIVKRVGKRYKIPFAEGRVIRCGEESSWVSVVDGETAGVKENHFAKKAANQSYSLGEKLAFPPRFWQKVK